MKRLERRFDDFVKSLSNKLFVKPLSNICNTGQKIVYVDMALQTQMFPHIMCSD